MGGKEDTCDVLRSTWLWAGHFLQVKFGLDQTACNTSTQLLKYHADTLLGVGKFGRRKDQRRVVRLKSRNRSIHPINSENSVIMCGIHSFICFHYVL